MLPHPFNPIADRIAALSRRAPASVHVETPLQTPSGCWEALGDGWHLLSGDPSEFADLLEARLRDGTKTISVPCAVCHGTGFNMDFASTDNSPVVGPCPACRGKGGRS